MAFELEDFTRTGSIGAGGALWMYTSDDSDEIILAANYFDPVYSSLRVGDIITTSSEHHLFFVKITGVANRVVTHILDSNAHTATNRVNITHASDFPAVLDSNTQYFIDGRVDIGTRSLEVPAGGLNLAGLGLELSFLTSSEPNHTMLTSPVGGSGNVLGTNLAFECTGTGSQVYDLVATHPFVAIEMNIVNYTNCSSLGTIDNYRQGLESGTGRFGGSPSLTLKGAWAGGFRVTTSITRSLDAGMTEPLFKAGTGFIMQSRFLTDMNVDLPASASFADFSPTNFPNPSTLQVAGLILTRGFVSNPHDTNYFPNIDEISLSSSWTNNQGLRNTFTGGKANVTTKAATTIVSAGAFVTLAGTFTAENIQHFDSPSSGQIRQLGHNPRDYAVAADFTIEGTANKDLQLRLKKYDASTTSFITVYTQSRQVNNFSGGRDVAFFNIMTAAELDQDDYLFFEVANITDSTNVTAEVDSFFVVQER